MTRDDLICTLHSLQENLHPLTGDRLGGDSCLKQPAVRAELIRLRERLTTGREQLVCRHEIAELLRDLRDLAYRPTPLQVAKVLTGSRSIVDPRLRGVPAYQRYRGVLTQRAIVAALDPWAALFAEDVEREPSRPEIVAPTAEEPESNYRDIDFFDGHSFDKLEPAKAREIADEVNALGMRKQTKRLPGYMQRARQRLPRAFEPWTREEKALLIEAMCYTNDAGRLAEIFGRSAASLRDQGQRLIYDSRTKAAA